MFVFVSVAILFPIQDQSIIGSSIDALTNLSASEFTSDKGFHIFLGLTGLSAGVTELLILSKSSKTATGAAEVVQLGQMGQQLFAGEHGLEALLGADAGDGAAGGDEKQALLCGHK